jgi:hypothetical protein
MPEQQRRADIGGQGAQQLVALERVERDGAAFVALNDPKQTSPSPSDKLGARTPSGGETGRTSALDAAHELTD